MQASELQKIRARMTSQWFASRSNEPIQPRLIPWIEKYRPQSVSEISHQEEVVSALTACIQKRNLPHLLFYGPAGSGKTSAALALCKELFGGEYRNRVLELNASDERGISVIREKVKTFAQYAVTASANLPSFKVIILDEADSMTKDAQAALRRTMEQFTKVTRFVLICNYVSRIIEPVTSRCAKFRFQAIAETAHLERLRFVATKENMTLSDTAYNTLVTAADGDLRRSISLLQSCKQVASEEIQEDLILSIAGRVDPSFIRQLLLAVQNKPNVLQLVKQLMSFGYNVTQFLLQFLELAMVDDKLTDGQKSRIALLGAILDERLNDGADEQVQMTFFISELIHVF